MRRIIYVEGWRQKLNRAFQWSHTILWTFLEKLIKEENNIQSDIINAMSRRQPPVGKDGTGTGLDFRPTGLPVD
jgi:hypothetical protein